MPFLLEIIGGRDKRNKNERSIVFSFYEKLTQISFLIDHHVTVLSGNNLSKVTNKIKD